nr:hypothetical protein [Nanoarchaeum sp.]
MKSKKGAIELSMTTIIVIVIGITLLTLGLAWVRSSFDKITKSTDEAFKMSDQAITEMFSDSSDLLKIVPDKQEIKKGKGVEVAVVFYNLEDTAFPFQAKTTPVEAGVPLNCVFVETGTDTSRLYELNSGANAKIAIRATTLKNTPLGYGGCNVDITSITSTETNYQLSKTLSVEVIG